MSKLIDDNGNPTDFCKRLMERVYEAVPGKCWHRSRAGKTWRFCYKCGHDTWPKSPESENPNLFFSLDAWREIWEGMDEQAVLVAEELLHIVDPSAKRNEHGLYELITGELYLLARAKPSEILKAVARTLMVDCDCADGIIGEYEYPLPQGGFEKVADVCPTCKGAKEISIWDAVMREVEG